MRKFQIRFCDRAGNGSFCYADVNDTQSNEQIAQTVKNETNKYCQDILSSWKNMRSELPGYITTLKNTVDVVEMKCNKKEKRWFTKRSGLKFTLTLSHLRCKYIFGKFK